jgi:phosphatidate cytidylyltransferase
VILVTLAPAVLWTLAAVFGVLVIASLAVAWLASQKPDGHGELVLRVKSWWLMVSLFSLALVFSRRWCCSA